MIAQSPGGQPFTIWGQSGLRTLAAVTIGSGSATFMVNGSSISYEPDSTVDIPGGKTTIRMAGSTVGATMSLTIEDDEAEEQEFSGVPLIGGFYTFSGITLTTNIVLLDFILDNAVAPATMGAAGAEPHVVCLDGSRIEVYHDGIYRFFEDPETGLVVNIGVDNTYITFVSVVDRDGRVYGHARFDIDNNLQLHGNFIEMLKGAEGQDYEWGDDKHQDVTISAGDCTVRVESRYRSVGVENSKWARGQTHSFGGVLAGLVLEPSSATDATPGPLRDTKLNDWDAHALSCDAHFPHIVSFFGASVIPGASDSHTLFEHGDVSVTAAMDDFSRLLHLDVRKAGEVVAHGEWSRADAKPAQDRAPTTTLDTTMGTAEPPTHTEGTTATDATRAVDHVVPLEKDGELLVRMQANGAASFAVRGVDVELPTGLLMERGTGSPVVSAAAGATTSTSLYEKVLEPHLAWRKGKQSKTTTAIGSIGAV